MVPIFAVCLRETSFFGLSGFFNPFPVEKTIP